MVANDYLNCLKVVFIATYPPRQCGIATFTADLFHSLKTLFNENGYGDCQGFPQIIALNDDTEEYAYGGEVSFRIRASHGLDYRHAADYINLSPADVVCLQHEFGIFGGKDGKNIIPFIAALKKPVVTTLHTILESPTPGQQKTLKEICDRSTLIVVLAQKAVSLLQNVYHVPKEKIIQIHHGTPDIPFMDTFYYKGQFKAEGRNILLTFGLLSPNKGIEYVIDALPEVVRQFPETLYFVLGATHPGFKRYHGEKYRDLLKEMVAEKAITDNVIFYNEYVTSEQLLQFIMATDIYINPYINKEQISSGTLAYALACGKAIVSTPYWYAEELLADGRGLTVPFRNSEAIGKALTGLLKDETQRNRMRKLAYDYGRRMVWAKAAKAYASVFEKALLNYRSTKPYTLYGIKKGEKSDIAPRPNLDHLRTLTDDTGLFQHAVFSTPDRFHGYCTDDNSRALIAAVMNWQMYKRVDVLPLIQVYLSFLHYAFNDKTLRMRNLMSYDRQWLEETGSEDCHGRTLWALGYTLTSPPDMSIAALTNNLFKKAVGITPSFTSPRAWAYTILGCLYYLSRFRGDIEAHSIIKDLSQRLSGLFRGVKKKGWYWCEEVATYDNARIPQALIAAGSYSADKEMQNTGLKALDWLIAVQKNPQNRHLSLIGNNDWYRYGKEKSLFDQQPLEISAIVDACYEAYLVTNDMHWLRRMEWAFAWFLGSNDTGRALYNPITGGCHDGLQPGGINGNQGGEATVSFLLAFHKMQQVLTGVRDITNTTKSKE